MYVYLNNKYKFAITKLWFAFQKVEISRTINDEIPSMFLDWKCKS